MIIETKFRIGQKVFIRENGYQPCQIDQIKLDGKNMFYHVFYWLNGDLKSLDIGEDELVSEIPNGKNAGFEARP